MVLIHVPDLNRKSAGNEPIYSNQGVNNTTDEAGGEMWPKKKAKAVPHGKSVPTGGTYVYM